MLRHNKFKIIISGGGTGGHVFPAIAVADAIKKMVQTPEILFVGAKGKMEMEKVPKAGYQILGLNISGIQRKLTYKNLFVIFKLIGSIRKAKKIIKEFDPDVVVGFGGYASGPTLRVATKKKIPTVIQEQNSFPGLTNRLLAKKVDKICVAYDNMDRFFPKSKIYLTGNPVRKDIANITADKKEAEKYFKLDEDKKTLLILGGSLGAKTINNSVKENIETFLNNGIQIIWQTGKLYFDDIQEYVKTINKKENIKLFAFIDRMDMAYAACDMVVSRSGAISVSEICITKKPAIFIPSPNVAEDHQTKNAMALVNHKAAIMIKDSEAPEKLGEEVINTIFDDEKTYRLKKKIAEFSVKDSAEKIASVILSLVN